MHRTTLGRASKGARRRATRPNSARRGPRPPTAAPIARPVLRRIRAPRLRPAARQGRPDPHIATNRRWAALDKAAVTNQSAAGWLWLARLWEMQRYGCLIRLWRLPAPRAPLNAERIEAPRRRAMGISAPPPGELGHPDPIHPREAARAGAFAEDRNGSTPSGADGFRGPRGHLRMPSIGSQRGDGRTG